MTQIYAIANQKGGVGKTTTSINLAASLANINKKVLLIDMDPQGNATMGSGVDKNNLQQSLYDVLVAEGDDSAAAILSVLQTVSPGGYDLIPANQDATAAEVELRESMMRELRLSRALQPIVEHYDYILLDCPPALSLLTVNALAAADGVIVPMQCEYYALEGLSALNDTITKIQQHVNAKLQITGILRTMFDPRNHLALDVSQQLVDYFGDKVYSTIVPRNVRLAEAPSHGLPVMYYDKSSTGAKAYQALVQEIVER